VGSFRILAVWEKNSVQAVIAGSASDAAIEFSLILLWIGLLGLARNETQKSFSAVDRSQVDAFWAIKKIPLTHNRLPSNLKKPKSEFLSDHPKACSFQSIFIDCAGK
jgi:hypothetical protein